MSTQHRDQLDLYTKLDRVEQRSRLDRKATFNNLGHLINLEMLRLSHHQLDGTKAVGIDGITKEEFERKLDENLKDLLMRIRRGSYHPKPMRIVEIPKSDGSMRPLAISCHEDKIVQEAVRRILERIYEPIFLDCSHGFRPKRGCETALIAVSQNLWRWDCGAILEIDLRKYFNTIPHEPLVKLLMLKIEDQRFLHLIIKLLKAPVLRDDGEIEQNRIGSPQGSILSPIIANLYLHYVLDIWFHWINGQRFGSKAHLVRYADDALFTFRKTGEAEHFRQLLLERLASFGISLNGDKTKVLRSGQYAAEDAYRQGKRLPAFTFLGFLHVWGRSWNQKKGKYFWRIKRRTCPIRFRKKLAEILAFIKKHRHERGLFVWITRIVQGYLNYFAVNDNQKRVGWFIHQVRRMLFKWVNRRSQRRSMTWEQLNQNLRNAGFPLEPHFKNLFFGSRCYPCR